jgi:hypothetical protein
MERKAHSKIPLVRGNAGTNQGMRPVDKNIHSLHRSIVGTRRRRRNGVAHTLRVSEKRRPSCNEDMSSVMWEETDDGDIATASMGGSGDRRLPCYQYSPPPFFPWGAGSSSKTRLSLVGQPKPPKESSRELSNRIRSCSGRTAAVVVGWLTAHLYYGGSRGGGVEQP